MVEKNLNLVSQLTPNERAIAEFRLRSVCLDDGKIVKEQGIRIRNKGASQTNKELIF